MSLAEDARKLRNEGKTYPEIADILNCSKSTVSYHLSEGQKEKSKNRLRKRRASKAFQKVENFQAPPRISNKPHESKPVSSIGHMKTDKICDFIGKPIVDKSSRFTFKDVIDKYGEKPKCYLTGENINLDLPRTYHFDHIIPRSKGGANTLDNLGLATKEANLAKNTLSVNEFLDLCEKVLRYHGRI